MPKFAENRRKSVKIGKNRRKLSKIACLPARRLISGAIVEGPLQSLLAVGSVARRPVANEGSASKAGLRKPVSHTRLPTKFR
jgi:hypothetical protein